MSDLVSQVLNFLDGNKGILVAISATLAISAIVWKVLATLSKSTRYVVLRVRRPSPEGSSEPVQVEGDVLEPETFRGRLSEIRELRKHLIRPRFFKRVVRREGTPVAIIRAFGGTGKSALAAKLCFGDRKGESPGFSKTLRAGLPGPWRAAHWISIQNGAPAEETLALVLEALRPDEALPKDPKSIAEALAKALRREAVLIVLDNIDTLIVEDGFAEAGLGYRFLLEAMLKKPPKYSRVVVTSRREVPLTPGGRFPRKPLDLKLEGLDVASARKLCGDVSQAVRGNEAAWNDLAERYRGNPLALRLATKRVEQDFDGNLREFLQQEGAYKGIQWLLKSSLSALTPEQKELLYWIAINREPVTRSALEEDICHRRETEAVAHDLALLVDAQIAESQDGRYMLQPVVLEFVTARVVLLFVALISHCDERMLQRLSVQLATGVAADILGDGEIGILNRHVLVKAAAKEHVRQSQYRLLARPVAHRFLRSVGSVDAMKARIAAMVDKYRHVDAGRRGYLVANALAMLRCVNADMRGLDFSGMPVWQADLQDVALHDVGFRNCDFRRTRFTAPLPQLYAVAVSPDGREAAVGSTDGAIRLWDVGTRTAKAVLDRRQNWAAALAYSPDGRYLAVGGLDNSVTLWDRETGRKVWEQWHREWVTAVAFTADGGAVVSGSDDCTAVIRDVRTGAEVQVIELPARVTALVPSADGRRLFWAGGGAYVGCWDLRKNRKVWDSRMAPEYPKSRASLDLDPKERLVLASADGRKPMLYDAATGARATTTGPASGVSGSLRFLNDSGRCLATDGHDLIVWEAEDPRDPPVKRLKGHSGFVNSVAVAREAGVMVSAADDNGLRTWSLEDFSCTAVVSGFNATLWSVVALPDGRCISGHEDGRIAIWPRDHGSPLVIPCHDGIVWSMTAVGADRALTCGNDANVCLVTDLASGDFKVLGRHRFVARSTAVTPDGTIGASGGEDALVKLWDLADEKFLKDHHGHKNRVLEVCFGRGGTVLYSGDEDGVVLRWTLKTGAIDQVTVMPGNVRGLCWDEDAGVLTIFDEKGHVLRWSDTGSIGTVPEPEAVGSWPVWRVAVHPETGCVATAGAGGDVRLHKAGATAPCEVLPTGHGTAWDLKFFPDGRLLISGEDGVLSVWDPATGDCLDERWLARPYEGMDVRGASGLSEQEVRDLGALGART